MPSAEDRLHAPSRSLLLMLAFGERLQTLRNEAGLSKEELAGRSRLNPTIITKVEAGQIDPSLSQIEALARGLGVPRAALIDGLAARASKMTPDAGTHLA